MGTTTAKKRVKKKMARPAPKVEEPPFSAVRKGTIIANRKSGKRAVVTDKRRTKAEYRMLRDDDETPFGPTRTLKPDQMRLWTISVAAVLGRAVRSNDKQTKPPAAGGPKKLSGLDAAALVLERERRPMNASELVGVMLNEELWSTGGLTPHATLYAAIIREIAAKGKESRFRRGAEKGTFEFNS